jgi:predicted nuclease of predicted toxin-antitoxin system
MAKRARSAPQLVWVRIGNTSNRVLWAAFDRMFPQLIQALEAGVKVVEIW